MPKIGERTSRYIYIRTEKSYIAAVVICNIQLGLRVIVRPTLGVCWRVCWRLLYRKFASGEIMCEGCRCCRSLNFYIGKQNKDPKNVYKEKSPEGVPNGVAGEMCCVTHAVGV